MSHSLVISVSSDISDMVNMFGKLNSDSSYTTYEEFDNSFTVDIRGLIKFDFSTEQYILYLKALNEKFPVEKTLMNIPSCCKDNPYACIEIKIDNSFSNKIMLCKKHYDSHMEHDNNSVSILGYILEQESKEANKTTKHHSVSTPSLEKSPEVLLSLQNIEEPMMGSLEKNTSNIPNKTINTKLEDVSCD